MAYQNRIKEARRAAGLTQKALADLVGVNKTTIAGYELRNREPSAEMLWKIALATGTDMNFIFQDEMAELDTDDLTVPEIKFAKKYRSLDDAGKKIVECVLQHELERMNQITQTPPIESDPQF